MTAQDHLAKIKKHFNSKYVDYAVCDAKVVPQNEQLQQALVNAIPFEKDQKLKMLDLGIGTGLTTCRVLNAFPNAQIDGIDFSTHMLKQVPHNLGIFKSNINLMEADFTKEQFKDNYDVIFSAVTIHDIPLDERKKLFINIFNHLKPNGCFINADFINFESPSLTKKTTDFYIQFLHKNLAGKVLEHWIRHATEEDILITLNQQFEWLKQAGFSIVECVWMYQNLAVYIATK